MLLFPRLQLTSASGLRDHFRSWEHFVLFFYIHVFILPSLQLRLHGLCCLKSRNKFAVMFYKRCVMKRRNWLSVKSIVNKSWDVLRLRRCCSSTEVWLLRSQAHSGGKSAAHSERIQTNTQTLVLIENKGNHYNGKRFHLSTSTCFRTSFYHHVLVSLSPQRRESTSFISCSKCPVFILLKLVVNTKGGGGRVERQVDCHSTEGRGRGAICSNILWISPRQRFCQSGSQEVGICHSIVTMAMTSALMTQCDTWKYNKQTAGPHTTESARHCETRWHWTTQTKTNSITEYIQRWAGTHTGTH